MGYEFTKEQDVVVDRAASWMRLSGRLSLGIGLLVGLPLLAGEYLVLPAAAFLIVIGTWTVRASKSFQRVTTTDGNDIQHVLDALDNLRKLYQLQAIIILLAFLAALILGFLGYTAT
ncbi:MAG: hypothetical protein AAGE01_24285 [Pseudomonadota bacterium]